MRRRRSREALVCYFGFHRYDPWYLTLFGWEKQCRLCGWIEHRGWKEPR